MDLIKDGQAYADRRRTHSLKSQFTASRLECNNYDFLTVHLYRQIYPSAAKDSLVLKMVGWDKGTFGNHSQLIVRDKGVSLLVDPNLGLIARTDLASLRKGVKVKPSQLVQFSFRRELTSSLETSLNRFRANVRNALLGGKYPSSVFLYSTNPDVILGYRKK